MWTIDDYPLCDYVRVLDDGGEVLRIWYDNGRMCRAEALSLASAITRIEEYHELALDVVRLADRNTDAGKRMFEAAVAVLRPIDRK